MYTPRQNIILWCLTYKATSLFANIFEMCDALANRGNLDAG